MQARAKTRPPVLSKPAKTASNKTAPKKPSLPVGGLIAGLVGLAVVPLSFLFFLWWQDADQPEANSAADLSASTPATAEAAPSQSPTTPALTSPAQIEANAGEVVAFPIAINTPADLPARSLIAINGLPQGATFSQGRPYGDTGWSLRPDEAGSLTLRLPPQSGVAELHVELVAGDGSVLGQSSTMLSIVAPPAEVATTGSIEASETSAAQAEPQPPSADQAAAQSAPTAEDGSAPIVNTVKTVAVDPPAETLPHDGASALGEAAEKPQAPAEWMQTKTAVDMHARAEQKSDTVKVAEGGLKVRVTARDKNWVQVQDPKSGTTGWIYNRFLTAADASAE
jgi:hypothetical protein